jgi:hypothetical protein
MESSSSTSTSRLAINKPIGNHGDTVLELQVRFANDPNIRRRVIQPHTTKRSTRPADNELREASVSSFLEMARSAAASGDPESAKNAIEHLALVERNNSYFSVVGDFADLALITLRQQMTRQEAENELQRRRSFRRWKLGGVLALQFVVSLLFVLDDPETEVKHIFSFLAVLSLMLSFCVRSLWKREDDAKKLVDELYNIASSTQVTSNDIEDQEQMSLL